VRDDALDRLANAIYGRPAEPRDWLGGSESSIFDDAVAEIASLRAALAAGPAALREFGDAEMTARTAAAHVEAAQKKAMGET
jgi:hypothetical protein